MIPRGVEVFVGLDPIDLRWGFDRLVGVVHERMARRARSGALYVFFGRGRTAMKVFFADSNGLCIFYKRLDKGTFRLPRSFDEEKTLRIDERVLDDLLEGIDIDLPTKH